jgi:hypothetical protein
VLAGQGAPGGNGRVDASGQRVQVIIARAADNAGMIRVLRMQALKMPSIES